MYQDVGRTVEAIGLYEKVREFRVKKLGANHHDTLHTLNNLAAAYWSLQRLDQSIPLFEEILARREKKLGRRHSDTLWSIANLGVNYKDAGSLGEAIPLLEEAWLAAKARPTLRWVGPQLFDAYLKARKSAEAAQLLSELLVDARKEFPEYSPQLVGKLAYFGATLLQAKAYTEAEPLLRECLTIREKTQPDVWSTFNIQSMLGEALLGQAKYADAESLLVKGYEGMKKREKSIPPQGKVCLTEALERLVQLYEATGKKEEAAKWRKELEAAKVVPAGTASP